MLPALEQGQGKGLLVMSCKKKVSCNVKQAVESVMNVVPRSTGNTYSGTEN